MKTIALSYPRPTPDPKKMASSRRGSQKRIGAFEGRRVREAYLRKTNRGPFSCWRHATVEARGNGHYPNLPSIAMDWIRFDLIPKSDHYQL